MNQFCSLLIKQSVDIPPPNDNLSSEKFRVISFHNNKAHAYGHDVATVPSQAFVQWEAAAPIPMVPGIDVLNMSLGLKDGLDQRIRGTAELPVPYIFESWLCRSSSEPCSVQQSLVPIAFFSISSESGVASTLSMDQTIVCGDSATVSAHFAVFGATSKSLTINVNLLCLKCGKMHYTIQEINKASTWYCGTCSVGQYVIDPDTDMCQTCPEGKKTLLKLPNSISSVILSWKFRAHWQIKNQNPESYQTLKLSLNPLLHPKSDIPFIVIIQYNPLKDSEKILETLIRSSHSQPKLCLVCKHFDYDCSVMQVHYVTPTDHSYQRSPIACGNHREEYTAY